MRLTPLPPESLSPELRSVHDTIVEVMVRGQPQIIAQDGPGALIGPFPAMLHFPSLGIPALRFLAAVGSEARLPALVRETVILTVGGRFNARYEIYAHEIMGAVAGLTPTQIALLATGGRPADLGDAPQVAHDLTRALVDGRTPPALLYERAIALLGKDGVGELVFLAGAYCLIALALNCFDMPAPEPAN